MSGLGAIFLALVLVGPAIAQAQETSPRSKKGDIDKPQAKQYRRAPHTSQLGTEQLPVIVRILPNSLSETEAAQDAKDRQERAAAERSKAELDRDLVNYNSDLSLYTKFLVCVGVL